MPLRWLEGCAGCVCVVDANDVVEGIRELGCVVYANGPTRCEWVCVVCAQQCAAEFARDGPTMWGRISQYEKGKEMKKFRVC